jgi:SAM-dependent methyltransferase
VQKFEQKANADCPICQGDNLKYEATYKASHDIFKGKHLFHCATCGMVFINPMPNEKEWDRYNNNFFSESLGGIPENKQAISFFKGLARIRLDYIESYIGTLPKNILEIGPGQGYFYEAYCNKCPDVTYTAIETDQTCLELLREVGVQTEKNINELCRKKESSFDLIVMSHVLEHQIAPHDFLNRVLSFLKPGGFIFIEVPCRDDLYKPIYDAHVLFYDKSPMIYLLSCFGLKNIKITYHGSEIKVINNTLIKAKDKIVFFLKRFIRHNSNYFQQSNLSYMDIEMWESVEPFNAEKEKEKPARWLRAIAKK